MSDRVSGKCRCGKVKFSAPRDMHLSVCHCSMCRSWTGSPVISADIHGEVTFENDDTLKWYDSSDWAERGFCGECGTSLFYRLKGKGIVAIMAGSLDMPENVPLKEHIFIDEKPYYYDFKDDAPRVTAEEFLARFN